MIKDVCRLDLWHSTAVTYCVMTVEENMKKQRLEGAVLKEMYVTLALPHIILQTRYK